ncbi:MAG: aldo/keto reductase, partial [Rubrobacter sp.]
MRYRRLGDTGLMVSELCLGTMTFGRELDEGGSAELLVRFLEAGGNFVDTADIYEVGLSEEITGRAIESSGVAREDLVLATKVRMPMGDGPNDVGLSRKHIIAGCEASLQRLGTDHIDLYQVHLWDAATPLEETLSALTDLVRTGKVRYIGCSNYAAWQLMKALWTSELKGYERFVSLQPQYSLVERNLEREILPACIEEGVGVMPWGPLGGGFLSGKYRQGEKPPEDSRIAGATDELEEAWHRRAVEGNWRTLDVMAEVSEETGKSFSQIALNWLLRQPGVTSPI